jgi:uncharacterized repeat protein (TIGR03803 family)
MRTRQLAAVTAMLAAPLTPTFSATAQTPPALTTLHSFAGGHNDGAYPVAGLAAGPNGIFYGTTKRGGAYGLGTVYQLTATAGGGSWTETVLYSFAGLANGDGAWPYSAVAVGGDGSLYGTTYWGGTSVACGSNLGCGTVFKLSPPPAPGGAWTETVLHSFPAASGDGFQPWGTLVIGAKGALYGTTQAGGIQPADSQGYGTVFELTPPAIAGGLWAERLLYSFGAGDGYQPTAGLVFGAKGELYGTTPYGGSEGWGTVFELTPGTGGTWSETILHSFTGQAPDGAFPSSPLVIGKDGALYGATGGASSAFCTIFELNPPTGADGEWTENTVYTFEGRLRDQGGFFPNGLVFGKGGLLYGTAYDGGASGWGNVYRLEPAAGGTWTHTILGSFDGSNGSGPNGGLIVGRGGDLYGTTFRGSAAGRNVGTVFQLVP